MNNIYIKFLKFIIIISHNNILTKMQYSSYLIDENDNFIESSKDFFAKHTTNNKNIVVISFIGVARSGKSTLINTFVSFLRNINTTVFKT